MSSLTSPAQQGRRRSTSSLTTPCPPPPGVAALLSRQPFRARSARRDLATSFAAFRAGWEALTRAVVLQDGARRLGERAGALLGVVEARLEAVEAADQTRTGSRVYEFQGGAGAETVFRLQALLLDIKAFAIDFASPSDRLSLLVTGLPAQQSALAALAKAVQACAGLYSVPLGTDAWPTEDALDRAVDLAALPRLFQVSVALRGPTYRAFIDASGTKAGDPPGVRRGAFVAWCLESNPLLRGTEWEAAEPERAQSPQRYTTIGALQTVSAPPVTPLTAASNHDSRPPIDIACPAVSIPVDSKEPSDYRSNGKQVTPTPTPSTSRLPATAPALVPAGSAEPAPSTSSTRRGSSSSIHSLIERFGTPTAAALKPKPTPTPEARTPRPGSRPKSAPQLSRAPSLPPPSTALPALSKPRAARRAHSDRIERSPTGDLQLWSSFPQPPPRESPPAAVEVHKQLQLPADAADAGTLAEAKFSVEPASVEADEELVDEFMRRRRGPSAESHAMSHSGSIDSCLTFESSMFDRSHAEIETIDEDDVPKDENGETQDEDVAEQVVEVARPEPLPDSQVALAASIPLPPSPPETEVELAYSSIFSAFDSPALLIPVNFSLSPPVTPAPTPSPASDPASAPATALPAHMAIPKLTLRPATPLTGESTPSSAVSTFTTSSVPKPLPPLPDQRPPRPLRVLALDGGGIRGATLIQQVRALLPEGQRACEAFDLIAGVGTGGLAAVLLGRMRLDCGTALSIYAEVARQAFVAKDAAGGQRRSRWSSLFGRGGGGTAPPGGEAGAAGRDVRLAKALQAFLPDYALLDRKAVADPGVACQTAVLAFPAGAGKGHGAWLTSWRDDEHAGLTVSQALRATTSTSSFFKPFKTGARAFGAAPVTVSVADAAFALAETVAAGTGRAVGVVSVGVGRVPASRKLPSKTKTRSLRAVAQLGDAAASAAGRARARVERAGGAFARLDVGGGERDGGVDEWEAVGAMDAAVRRGVELAGQADNVREVLSGERGVVGSGGKGKGRVAERRAAEDEGEGECDRRQGRSRRSASLSGLRSDFASAQFYLHGADAAGSTGSLNLHF